MTTTTVDTQVEAASSGGMSTPVKLTLQPGTMAVAIQMNVATARGITPTADHDTRRREFTLYWAFSPDDLSATLSQVPTLLMGCAKSQGLHLQKAYDANQKIQVRDKVSGQYLYCWFEYPTSLDQYTITVKATELFILSDPVNPAFVSVTISQTALGTTSTDGLFIRNTTVSTAGATVQYSPRIHLLGHAWNTTAVAADNYLEMTGELRPVSGLVPSSNFVLGFRTSTDGTTGAFTDRFVFTSVGNLQVGNGTAAAPSYSFTSDATKGFYSAGTNLVGVAIAGAASMRFAADGSLTNSGGDAILKLSSTDGHVNITAGGTNQSIILTPSGTGSVQLGALTATSTTTPLLLGAGGTYGTSLGNGYKLAAYNDGTNTYGIGVNASRLYLGASDSGTAVAFVTNNIERGRFSPAGNLLLGGLTTDGTGVLQLPAATNTAGGISFGTDTTLYRSTAGSLVVNSTGDPSFALFNGAVGQFPFGISGSNASTTVFIGNILGGYSLTFRTGSAANALILDSSQNTQIVKKITSYNGVATAGWGVPAIQGAARTAGATGATASVTTYTVGAADGSFEVSANVNVTTSTAYSFSATCTYTDETNTSRTITLPFIQVGGVTLVGTITNVTGAGPYEGVSIHIRAKAGTTITIATTGTFTTVTYNAEGVIKQIQ